MSETTKPVYYSTKTWGHNMGLSAAFRQWRAESHCRLIHGYSLAITLTFATEDLDVRNWVVDFGSLKSLKGWIENTFDHKTVVAEDDPEMEWFVEAEKRGIIDLVVVENCGCEKFAELIYKVTEMWLESNGYAPRCRIVSCEVKEHGANSAIYKEELV